MTSILSIGTNLARRFFPILGLLAALAVTGCAHPIVISPNVANLERDAGAKPIAKNVGYYISAENRNLAVTTPGGGGDKITYRPYGEIETAFYKTLTNVFSDVTALKSANDAEAIAKHRISYVITPAIATDSSSSSAFTWPPTYFKMDINCAIADSTGKTIATKAVTGEGRAEFSEFKSDFALAAKRAAEDALKKLQTLLLKSDELRN
jgi:hypothetical protein